MTNKVANTIFCRCYYYYGRTTCYQDQLLRLSWYPTRPNLGHHFSYTLVLACIKLWCCGTQHPKPARYPIHLELSTASAHFQLQFTNAVPTIAPWRHYVRISLSPKSYRNMLLLNIYLWAKLDCFLVIFSFQTACCCVQPTMHSQHFYLLLLLISKRSVFTNIINGLQSISPEH